MGAIVEPFREDPRMPFKVFTLLTIRKFMDTNNQVYLRRLGPSRPVD